jgi:hypothetical protein
MTLRTVSDATSSWALALVVATPMPAARVAAVNRDFMGVNSRACSIGPLAILSQESDRTMMLFLLVHFKWKRRINYANSQHRGALMALATTASAQTKAGHAARRSTHRPDRVGKFRTRGPVTAGPFLLPQYRNNCGNPADAASVYR